MFFIRAILLLLLPLFCRSAPASVPNKELAATVVEHAPDFGEAKHEQNRIGEAMEELADLADEEKKVIDELEAQNRELRERLGEANGEESTAEIEEESVEEESGEKGRKPQGGRIAVGGGGRRSRLPTARGEFNIQQNFNNNTGTITIINGGYPDQQQAKL